MEGVIDDVVDFNDTSKNEKELQEELKLLMYKKKYIDACKYCGLDNHVGWRTGIIGQSAIVIY